MTLNEQYWSQVAIHQDSTGQEFCAVGAATLLFGLRREQVQIRAPYLIGRFPVTKAQFLHFLRQTGYDYDDKSRAMMERISPFPNCPATPVSWWDAKNYIRWMRKTTGEYYSLPSEWEWEMAARGTDGRAYPWGSEPPTPTQAVYSVDLPRMQTGVVNGQMMAESPLGCWDMVGNVWEWCLDSFDDENELHVLRGGAAPETVECCNCTAKRYSFGASQRIPFVGFRMTYLPGNMFTDYCSAMQAEGNPNDTVIEVVRPRIINPAPGLY